VAAEERNEKHYRIRHDTAIAVFFIQAIEFPFSVLI
jgi:hypothetical protein